MGKLWLRQEDRPSKKDKKLFSREEVDRNKASSSLVVASAPTSWGSKKSKPAATFYKAVDTIFREPIYKLLGKIKSQPLFKWPQPMKPTSKSTSRTGT